MSLMSINRIKYLRGELDDECIGLGELCEIEDAFALIPDEDLPEDRENALAGDMLDELEQLVTPVERAIYDHVVETFGESEANDPSWDIGDIANMLEKQFTFKERK